MENCTVTPSFNSALTEQHMAGTADFNSPSFAFSGAGLQNSAVSVNSDPTVGQKRKRGRPRKYDANLTSPKSAPLISPPSKRGRGRPRGSGNLQKLASMGEMYSLTAGGSFVPHVLVVNAGQDLLESVVSFSSKGRSLCILSATGTLSFVEIHDSFGRQLLSQEGFFDIICFHGSYGGIGGDQSQKSLQMRISLARPNGTVFGGSVGGRLIAAGPIQVILGSFKQNIFTGSIKKRLSLGSSGAANEPGASDLARLSLQVPRLIESEQSFPSPTSGLMPMTSNGFPDHVTPRTSNGYLNNGLMPMTSNGFPDHITPRTSNGFPNNVTAATTNGNGIPDFYSLDPSMYSTSMNGSSLDNQILQPFTDPMTFGDINNNVSYVSDAA